MSGARGDLGLEHLAVLIMEVAVGLEAQQVPHAYAQLGAVHRLAQEVFRPGLEASHLRLTVVTDRDHDDRNVPRRGVGLETLRERVPVHDGHHDVQQDEIGRIGGDAREGLGGACSALQHEALGPEHDLQQPAVLQLVVDDEDPRGAIGTIGRPPHRRTSSAAIAARNC